MPENAQDIQQLHERFTLLEQKFAALAQRLERLLEKLESGEDWPLRYMPQPGNMNEVPHQPGQG
jgi:hypothetical protein